jgi:hypothetical protein
VITANYPYPELTGSFFEKKLRYDPTTGNFIKLDRAWRGQRPGDVLGCISKYNGYVYVTIDEYHMLAHRLAYLYMLGKWPTAHIDHINSIKHDNRWCNLRPATNAQNLWGSKLQDRNQSGCKGVRRSKDLKKWTAFIGVNKKQINLGTFALLEDAVAARKEAEKLYHGGFSK